MITGFSIIFFFKFVLAKNRQTQSTFLKYQRYLASNMFNHNVIHEILRPFFIHTPIPCVSSITPARTLSISGLKSRVLKLSFLSLKMMVKSGLEFILKFTEPLQRYLLSSQANSAILGRYFCTGQQQL